MSGCGSDSDSVRRKVAAIWTKKYDTQTGSKGSKRTLEDPKEEEEEVIVSKKQKSGSANCEPTTQKIEVIDLDSDTEVPAEDIASIPSPFSPIHNPTYDYPKLPNSITIEDLLSSRKLSKCYIFSFQHQLDFILPKFHSKEVEVYIIHQHGTVSDSLLRASFPNLHLIEIPMAPYATYHSKLIVNMFNDKTVQIHLLSCNMTDMEFNTNNQMIWSSPLLHERAATAETSFQRHLIDFLTAHPSDALKKLIIYLRKYDFRSIRGEFVSSVSGTSSKFGFLGLYDCLNRNNLLPKSYDQPLQILYQTSSIASPISYTKREGEASNIFTHLLAPLVTGQFTRESQLITERFPLRNGAEDMKEFQSSKNVQLYLVYASLSDVRNSLFGYQSGGWSHYNPHTEGGKRMNDTLLSKFFCHSYTAQRRTNPSHTKFFLMSSDGFKTLDWVLFTSANLSKQAWGSMSQKNKLGPDSKIFITNYETGILIHPAQYGDGKKLIPFEIGEKTDCQKDEVPIILPFKLPPERYSDKDTAWVVSQTHEEQDIAGAIHIPPY